MPSRLLLSLLLLPLVCVAAFPAGQDAKKAEPINLSCNGDGDEVDPFVGSDNRVIYYSYKPRDGKKFSFYASRRSTPAANWPLGKEMDEPNIASKADDRGFTATAEGAGRQYIYFASRKDDDPDASFDLYSAYKDGPGRVYTAVTPIRGLSSKDEEMHPWLTGDGRALYFSKKTADGWRLFVSRRTDAPNLQGFGEPKLVEELPPNFHCATTTPDGRTMYLQGPLEGGKTGLFVTKWTGKEWDKPSPLEMLNHPEAATGDMMPTLTRDGSKLYFVSDRPGGKGGLDLWVVPVMQLR